MENPIIYFALHLGKKIMHIPDKQEFILDSISKDYVIGLSSMNHRTPLIMADCRICTESISYVIDNKIPSRFCLIKNGNGEYKKINDPELRTPEEKETEFLNELYACAGTDKEEMDKYKRKKIRELVWARQIHIMYRKYFMGKSFADAASVYGKDHATAIHACEKIDEFLMYDKDYKYQFKSVFLLIKNMHGEKAENKLDLSWLK